ncbi:hypothetical protein NQZ68_020407 [Dissostichus eleginoides]|uniref:Uncharacterized protein n=2 Tax=Notothenioidei TaxID=8205 RepID=A0AAN8HHR9_CHAGU|nr:hypothetical protein NQZ68_020407 [Dissostichus eleginoides]KAK5857465.1 hypothetical protein PBY51_010712 [Eleginops maclovinus]KAK5916849.1 hypothetical protein CgunFtcFv8_011792 [Champsocephalus gunnari]
MRALMSEAGSGPTECRSCSYLIEPSPLADGALLRALLSPIITRPRHRWKCQSASQVLVPATASVRGPST